MVKKADSDSDQQRTESRNGMAGRDQVDTSKFTTSNKTGYKCDRRSLIQSFSAVGAFGFTVTSSSSVAGQTEDDDPLADDPDIPGGTEVESSRQDRRSFLVSEYGEKEASIIQGIANKYRRQSKQGSLGPEEAFQEAGDEILEHPQTPNVSADIRERRELLTAEESQNEKDASATAGIDRSDDISTAAVGDSTRVEATRGQRDGSTWGVGAADREFNVGEQRIRANARVTGIGGATGWARIFGRLTPNSSIGGAVRMTANYFRQGSAVGGNADIRFFVRETGRPSSTAVFRTVESPGFVQGNTTRSEQFVLPAGIQHDIGIEIRTSVDTIAAAYFYADYFSRVIDLSRRRVVLNRPIRIEALD